MGFVEILSGTLDRWAESAIAAIPALVVAALVLIAFVLVAKGLRRLVRGVLMRRGRPDLAALLASFVLWATMAAGALVALTVVLPNLNPADLIAGLGIGSLAIGFAFKDIFQNWLAGLLILIRRPFRRGDQIRTEHAEGTVEHVEARATVVRTYDGRQVMVPNALIYTQPVIVLTAYARRRVELDVTVGYDYPFGDISSIILEAIEPLEGVLDEPPPQVICTGLGPTSLAMTVRWWIKPQRAEEIATRSRVVRAIRRAFKAHGVDPTDPNLIVVQRAGRREQASLVPVGGGDETEAPAPLRCEPRSEEELDPEPRPDDPENAKPREGRLD